MAPIRILLAAMPLLARDMIEQMVSDEPDLEIVGVAESQAEFRRLMRTTDPQFLVLALRGRLALDCRSLLNQPGVRVIAIDETAGPAYFCELVGMDIALSDAVKAIRSAASRPPLLDKSSS